MSAKTKESARPVRDDEGDSLAAASALGPASWQSRLIERLLWRLPIKKKMASTAIIRDQVRRLALRPASYAPTSLGRDVRVDLTGWAGWPVYETSPSSGASRNRVLFLHGGGFINEIVPAHWRFVAHLTRTARVRCIVPIYPVAPRGTAGEIIPALGGLLRKVIEEAGSEKVTVVGNSAGAGMALAVAQWLRDAGHRQPSDLVLISPALDASVSRPEQVEIATRDPMNDIPGMREVARLYAGELDVTHPWVSPLNGDLHGLAPIAAFAGTHDLLFPDSVALAAKARSSGVPVELHLRQGQPHNYAGMPTPEGREARESILHVLAR